MRYAKAVRQRRIETNNVATEAISIPFASVPMSLRQRKNIIFDDIPAPAIPNYMAALKNPQPGSPLEHLLPLLIEFDEPWPRAWHVVSNVTHYAMCLDDKFSMPRGFVKPQRIVTPRLTYDLDDNFDPRLVAEALGNSLFDIRRELVRQLEDMTEIMQQGAHGRQLRFHLALALPEFFAKREAWMLEFFTYMRHVGYICYE